MSLAKEDWKGFFNLSGQVTINDALGEDDDAVYCSVLPGEWYAMCEYSDDHRINHVVAMHESLSKRFDGSGVIVTDDGSTYEHASVDSRSGVMFIADRRLKSNLPESFDVPDEKLNPEIVEAYGKPSKGGKPDADRFMESCLHLARDHKSKMPQLDSLGFGTVFELERGKIGVDLLYNRMRDVMGFEISMEG